VKFESGCGFPALTESLSRRGLRILREPFFEATTLPKDAPQSLIDNVIDTRRAEKFNIPVERKGERFLNPHAKLSLRDLGIRWSEQRHHRPPCEIVKLSPAQMAWQAVGRIRNDGFCHVGVV
jgi:hypothetical protein